MNPSVCELEDIVSGEHRTAHVVRLKKYRESGSPVLHECREQSASDDDSLIMKEIMDVRVGSDNRLEFLVEWEFFGPETASWECLDAVFDLAPDLLFSALDDASRRSSQIIASKASVILMNLFL